MEKKNYEFKEKKYSSETLQSFWRIYCFHDCEKCKVFNECFSVKWKSVPFKQTNQKG